MRFSTSIAARSVMESHALALSSCWGRHPGSASDWKRWNTLSSYHRTRYHSSTAEPVKSTARSVVGTLEVRRFTVRRCLLWAEPEVTLFHNTIGSLGIGSGALSGLPNVRHWSWRGTARTLFEPCGSRPRP